MESRGKYALVLMATIVALLRTIDVGVGAIRYRDGCWHRQEIHPAERA